MPGRSTNNPSDYIAYGFQTAKGTDATVFYFLKHREGSGWETDTQMVREREGGDGQEIGLSYKTRVTGDGGLNHGSRPEGAARAMGAILGKDTATVITNPLTDHFLTPQASIPYITVEQGWDTVVERNSDCKANELTISFEAGKMFMYELGFLSGGTQSAGLAAQSPTREAARPFVYPGASVGLGGGFASGAKVTRGQIKAARNIDDGIQTNTLFREDLVELAQDYTVNITAKYENAALWRQVDYNGGSLVTPDIATTALTVFAAQGSFQQEIQLPLLEITNAKVNRLIPDGQTMYLDIAAETVKGATFPMWGRVRTAATAAYF